MINPICRMCAGELEKFGGILLSPPDEHDKFYLQTVVKSHLCKGCYEKVTNFITNSRRERIVNESEEMFKTHTEGQEVDI